jgi:hypothetical protein
MFGHSRFASEIRTTARFCRRVRLCGEFRDANRGFLGNFDIREEAVSPPSNGFNKAGTLRRVAESLTDFADRFVEPMVKIHESVRGPEFFLKLLPGYDLAGMLKQHRQDLEWLFLKANSKAMLAQFASAKIQFEYRKAESHAKVKVFLHKEVNAQRNRVYHLERPYGNQGWGTSSCKPFKE